MVDKSKNRFDLNSEGLGSLICISFLTEYIMKLAHEWLQENKHSSSEDFIRYFLMPYLCRLTDDDLSQTKDIDQVGKPSLNHAQADKLTGNDLQLFAHEFLTNTDDLKSLSVEFGRENGESNCDYLRTLIIAKEVTSKIKKNLFSVKTHDLITENSRLSSEVIYNFYNAEDASDSPAVKTNRHLENVAELITNMNMLGISMASDSAIQTVRTRIWNRVMFTLGFVTLVVSAVVSYLSYASSKLSDISSGSSALEQIHLLTEQMKNQDRIISELSMLNLKLVNPEVSSKLGLIKKDELDNNAELE